MEHYKTPEKHKHKRLHPYTASENILSVSPIVPIPLVPHLRATTPRFFLPVQAVVAVEKQVLRSVMVVVVMLVLVVDDLGEGGGD